MPTAINPPVLRIPAIDLSPRSGQADTERAAILLDALNTVGFLHVSTRVPVSRGIFDCGQSLFERPLKEKEAVGFDVTTGAGYTSMMGQTTGNKSGRYRGDLKESFSIGTATSSSIPPSFQSDDSSLKTLEDFRQSCFDCGLRLLDLFTIALKTPENDSHYFRKRHTYGNNESLRLIHYPAFPVASPEELIKQGRTTSWAELKIGEKDIRAGAHQHFGSATLLFQSPPTKDGADTAVEGLEIFVAREDGTAMAPDGSGQRGWWIPAPKPQGVSEGGSILVNVGVSMQIWSGEQFKATWHRVICPKPSHTVPGEVLPGRKSVVFFMIPDHDVVLTPIDGDGNPAIAEGCMKSGEYFKIRMNRSYGPLEEERELGAEVQGAQ